MEKIFENEEMLVISNHSLDVILNDILKNTLDKFNLYRKIFKVEKLDKITLKIFDDLDEYRKDAFQVRGVQPAEYSRGWFNSRDKVSNVCIEYIKLQEILNDPIKYKKKVASNAHESFHYYYKKYYYKNNRITWFDEGLAQFISGEYSDLTENNLKEKYLNFINNYIPINNLNDRVNGNKDIPDNLIFKREGVFQGYEASFFCIKYLVDTKGIEYIYELMFNNDEILKYGNHILEDMINYYNNKYQLETELNMSHI